MTAVLECDDVRSGYGTSEVIAGVNLQINEGDIYALIGKNGAGKTTLLQTVLGAIELKAGSVKIFGNYVHNWPTHRIMTLQMACAPQDKALFQDLSVDVNLRLGSLNLGNRQYRQGRERVIEIFPFIAERLSQKAGTLSGGEQGMLKLARALIPKPMFLLLDEITEGLNPIIVDRVMTVLRHEHEQRGVTVWLIEQNVDFVAGLATRYALIEKGSITGEGSFSEEGAQGRIIEHLSI